MCLQKKNNQSSGYQNTSLLSSLRLDGAVLHVQQYDILCWFVFNSDPHFVRSYESLITGLLLFYRSSNFEKLMISQCRTYTKSRDYSS